MHHMSQSYYGLECRAHFSSSCRDGGFARSFRSCHAAALTPPSLCVSPFMSQALELVVLNWTIILWRPTSSWTAADQVANRVRIEQSRPRVLIRCTEPLQNPARPRFCTPLPCDCLAGISRQSHAVATRIRPGPYIGSSLHHQVRWYTGSIRPQYSVRF